jgi:glucosamine--fructose-6-phosphate aminotransferase (isomerizing)
MCGIVGAVSTRNIVPILVQGLQRLEYRGYDSCGVAVHGASLDGSPVSGLRRARSTSRVAELMQQVSADDLQGGTGIAHTRWATHGAPAVHNAHPHFSHGPGADAQERPGRVALVHNGIIENHEELRAELQATWLPLHQPDRHRGDRAPGRQPVRRRPVRSGASRR